MSDLSSDAVVGGGDVSRRPEDQEGRTFLLQRAQPALAGLMDGSLSTLAPVFTVALATQRPHYALFAGPSSPGLLRGAVRHR